MLGRLDRAIEMTIYALASLLFLLFLGFALAVILQVEMAHAENVPQGCYRSTDNLWACYSPSDGAVNFPDMGSPVLNSIQYGTAIGALVTICARWSGYSMQCSQDLITAEFTIARVKKKLRKQKLLANRRCN